jgi:hypothetical protein
MPVFAQPSSRIEPANVPAPCPNLSNLSRQPEIALLPSSSIALRGLACSGNHDGEPGDGDGGILLHRLEESRTPGEGAKQSSVIKQESMVKSRSVVSVLLIDCGRASKRIQRGPVGAFMQLAIPPFIRFYF